MPATFADLLQHAVTEPGTLSSAYRQFHHYSLGNQLLALQQCAERGIPLGPIASFARWKALGRHVRKGEKALTLCMPVTRSKTMPTTAPDGSETHEDVVWTQFVYKPNWFVLAQTDGADVAPEPIPGWEPTRALTALNIAEVPFDHLDGNVMGYAQGRSIVISPLNTEPHKTRFHEIAHILLGHTAENNQHDSPTTPRNLRECEAEAVALLCCAALDLPGIEESRGYIQNWWGSNNPIPERSAQRVMKVADQILRAGQEVSSCASC